MIVYVILRNEEWFFINVILEHKLPFRKSDYV